MIGKKIATLAIAALTLGTTAQMPPACGDEVGEPYIDHLKKVDPALAIPTTESEHESPYIDSVKAKMKNGKESSSDGYTEKIKKELDGGEPTPETTSTPSYTEGEKGKLPPVDETSAIGNVQKGNSSLKYEKKGEIHNSFGIKFGLGRLTTTVTPLGSVGTGQAFSNVYGGDYAPDIALYYEYMLLRGYVGNFGIFGLAEVGIFKGLGTFQVTPTDPVTGVLASPTSGVQFTFVEVPVVVGFDYRFTLFKYVQPFIMAGPSLIGGVETRNDGNANHWVLSYGGYGGVGLSFLMDWVSRHDDWDRYQQLDVKHTYLSLEYGEVHSIGGAVSYDIAGPYLGVTFEF